MFRSIDIWLEYAEDIWMYKASFTSPAYAFRWVLKDSWNADDLVVIGNDSGEDYDPSKSLEELQRETVLYQWSESEMEEAYEAQIEITTHRWVSVRRFDKATEAMEWCRQQTSYEETIRVVRAIWPSISLRGFGPNSEECQIIMCHCVNGPTSSPVDWKRQGF